MQSLSSIALCVQCMLLITTFHCLPHDVMLLPFCWFSKHFGLCVSAQLQGDIAATVNKSPQLLALMTPACVETSALADKVCNVRLTICLSK